MLTSVSLTAIIIDFSSGYVWTKFILDLGLSRLKPLSVYVTNKNIYIYCRYSLYEWTKLIADLYRIWPKSVQIFYIADLDTRGLKPLQIWI